MTVAAKHEASKRTFETLVASQVESEAAQASTPRKKVFGAILGYYGAG